MNAETIRTILNDVADGGKSVADAMEQLRRLPYDDISFAKLDTHRGIRTGFPEVVFCQGKETGQIVDILKKLSEMDTCIMGTRATREVYEAVLAEIPDAEYFPTARIVRVGNPKKSVEDLAKASNYVAVLCAGTADLPVAMEAVITAQTLGSRVETAFDVGVAGLHRLLGQQELLQRANVLVVAAGMEGALPSVVAGLVGRPVIAVPTSVGYGASFGGLAAMLAMLNSCATGVSVVNIDNGFGAGYLAHMVNTTNENSLS